MRKTVEELQVTNSASGFRRSAESGGTDAADESPAAAATGSYKATQPTAAAVNGTVGGDHVKRASPESDFGMGKNDQDLVAQQD